MSEGVTWKVAVVPSMLVTLCGWEVIEGSVRLTTALLLVVLYDSPLNTTTLYVPASAEEKPVMVNWLD